MVRPKRVVELMQSMREVAFILGSRGIALGLQLSVLAGIGRLIGSEGVGLYQLFLSWILVLSTMGAFGAPLQNLRDAALASALRDPINVRRAFIENLLSAAITSGTLATVVLIFSGMLRHYLLPQTAPGSLMVLIAIGAFLLALLRTATEGLKGVGAGEIGIFLETGFPYIGLLVYFAAILLSGRKASVVEVTLVHLASLLLSFFTAYVAWLFLQKKDQVISLEIPLGRRVVFQRSRPIFGTITTLRIISMNVAVLLMPIFLETAEIGLFAASQRLVMSAGAIIITLNAYFAPRFVKYYYQRDVARLRRELQLSQIYSLILYLPLFLTFVVVPSTVLSIIGTEFTRAATILQILALGQLINCGTGLASYFLCMTFNEAKELYVTIISIALLVLLLLILGPKFRTIGAAISVGIYLALKNVLSYLISLLYLRHYSDQWQRWRRCT